MTGPTLPPRQRVVVAARELFVAHGYVDTSIGAVAREAGVALQTIYSGFGSKVGVLAAVQDETLAGDARAVPMLERPWVAALDALPPPQALHSVVVHLTAATARAAPVLGVVRAAASDPGVGDLLDTIHDQRATTCLALARRVVGRRHAQRLADSLYVLLGVETHDLLVGRRGWSRRRWQAWAETCLLTQLEER